MILENICTSCQGVFKHCYIGVQLFRWLNRKSKCICLTGDIQLGLTYFEVNRDTYTCDQH